MQDEYADYEADDYYDENEEFDDLDANEAYYQDRPPRYSEKRPPEPPAIVQQALDWGISGSILAVLVLTALYLFSPFDFVPDLIPVAGQADDLAAVLAGSGSVGFLTVMRYVLRTRVGRIGCLVAIILTAIGAFAVFWLLMSIFESVV